LFFQVHCTLNYSSLVVKPRYEKDICPQRIFMSCRMQGRTIPIVFPAIIVSQMISTRNNQYTRLASLSSLGLLILQPKHLSCHAYRWTQTPTWGEGCPLMPLTRSTVGPGSGHAQSSESLILHVTKKNVILHLDYFPGTNS
jgi:hypothetical protein